ncbi:MAG: hypothetical protein MUC89_22830, partial [Acetobacteraceae bacterium]|nr:hypothetical protein [Acetobacteraceae bacterium]
MTRRALLILIGTAVPLAMFARSAFAQGRPQPQPGPRHDEVLGRDFDALPPGARAQVQSSFRVGAPDLDDAAIRQRWNAMTPQQRGETLTARERAQLRAAPQGRGPANTPAPGTGRGPGPGPGTRQGSSYGPGPG